MAIFTNQAQLRYGNAVANSNVAVGEILEVLAATKTAVRKTYGQNDRVTYVVSIVNSGNTAMTGLTVADDLGAYAFGTDTLVWQIPCVITAMESYRQHRRSRQDHPFPFPGSVYRRGET